MITLFYLLGLDYMYAFVLGLSCDLVLLYLIFGG
jgi:hypothetical protein